MSSSLNVIALISGGKDSLYSLLHCVQNGHKVVALANLYPPKSREDKDGNVDCHDVDEIDLQEADDINSFMYQTVGHSIIPLYSRALNLPLYRRAITGTATETGRYYDPNTVAIPGSADETEDLVPLLKEIIQKHPEANAVSSGAILSTYQRTRIESVASRLKLAPLAFLWQYPALPAPVSRMDSLTGLLDDMAAAGCDARLIKIASGGIHESLLWSDVSSARTRSRLVVGMSPFFQGQDFWLRGAILGEGGEYETLATNGPTRVWKNRIDIKENDNVVVSDEGGACHLRFGKASLVEQGEPADEDDERDLVRVPVLVDEQFSTMLEQVLKRFRPGRIYTQSRDSTYQTTTVSVHEADQQPTQPQPLEPQTEYAYEDPSRRIKAPTLLATINSTPNTNTLTIANITSPECPDFAHLVQHLRTILHSVNQERQSTDPISPDDIVFATILLAAEDDADFAARFTQINAEYSKLFTKPNPPARVTVACDLQPNTSASISVVLDFGLRELRRGLHVQSRSYWAPANIGPYSQAICVPLHQGSDRGSDADAAERAELVHVAGQIPLVPHTMELLEGSFPQQAVLSLQHLWRIGQEREVDWWTVGIAFLASTKADDIQRRARVACKLWEDTHRPTPSVQNDESEEDTVGPDAWDLKHNRSRLFGGGLGSSMSTTPPMPSGKHLHALPNKAVLLATSASASPPPFLAVEVAALPRGAAVEWQSLGLGRMPKSPGSRACISLYSKTTPWGRVSHCVVLCGGWGAEPEKQMLDFACLQIDHGQEQELTSAALLDALDDDDDDDDVPPEAQGELPRPTRWEIVQATAYVMRERDRDWDVLSKLQSLLQATVIVPCRAIWAQDSRRLTLAVTSQRVASRKSS